MSNNLPKPAFYDRNQGALLELAHHVELPADATQNLESFVSATQPWVKGDHVRPGNKLDISPNKTDILHGLYGVMGLKDEQVLPVGEYDQILVLGGMHLGNNRRLRLLRRMVDSVEAKQIVLLGGERRVYPEAEDVLIEHNIDELRERHIDDPWSLAVQKGKTGIKWESDMLRLAASVHFGKLSVAATSHYKNDPIAYPEITDMRWDEGDLPIRLLHTKAVARPGGEARHTTEACIKHWLRVMSPAEGARVGFVTANPHIERTGTVAANIVSAAGRDDIELSVSGSAAAETMSHHIYLGEIARNLYECLQAERAG